MWVKPTLARSISEFENQSTVWHLVLIMSMLGGLFGNQFNVIQNSCNLITNMVLAAYSRRQFLNRENLFYLGLIKKKSFPDESRRPRVTVTGSYQPCT